MLFRPFQGWVVSFATHGQSRGLLHCIAPFGGERKPAPSGAATITAHGFSRGKKEQFQGALERATQRWPQPETGPVKVRVRSENRTDSRRPSAGPAREHPTNRSLSARLRPVNALKTCIATKTE